MRDLFRQSRYLLAIIAPLIVVPYAVHGDEVDFKREIAPILKERCWMCHGENTQDSGLRLDRRKDMLKGGDSGLAAVVPGKPDESFLLDVINHRDNEIVMPLDEEKLPKKEIDLITQWIKEGAKWPGQMEMVADEKSDHWSFQPIVRAEIPNTGEVSQNPIDAFLLQRLQKEGLSFSKSADPRSLLRRVSIVLTGVPPTPTQTANFLDAGPRISRMPTPIS